jgi:hypothetical protein
MGMDDISLDDSLSDVSAYEGFLRKIAADVRTAIPQVYSLVVQAQLKLIAMRWDIPFTCLPFPAALRDAARKTVEKELDVLCKPADVLIFTDHDYELLNTLVEKGGEAAVAS